MNPLVLLADPCSYCGGGATELDHIVPKFAGGRDDDNLTATCRRCNQSKGARSLLTFLLARSKPLTGMEQLRRTFGENMRARRLALGLTQWEVAGYLGLSLGAVVRWECGTSMPRSHTLDRLADFYGVSHGWFFTEQAA